MVSYLTIGLAGNPEW